MLNLACYLLTLKLQSKWIETSQRAHPREWIAGLSLRGNIIHWFGLKFGEPHRVEFLSLKSARNPVGSVHYHCYEHSRIPAPSRQDGLNWFYHCCNEIPDHLNPIFFIVFSDSYASWAIFPKPPVIKDELHRKLRKSGAQEISREIIWDLCLEFLDRNMIKAGIFKLGERDQQFRLD